MTVSDAVWRALRDWEDVPVCIDLTRNAGDQVLSAEDFLKRITVLEELFAGFGIVRGDPVILALENSAEYITAFLALCRLGAVVSPVKPVYRSLALNEIFSNLDPVAVIVDEANEERFAAPSAAPALIVRRGTSFVLRREAVGRQGRVAADEAIATAGDIATINYTYRGFGYPLGAMIPHSAYLEGARIFAEGMAGQISRRMLVILPMSHIFTLVGCVFAPLLSGITTVIADTGHPRKLLELCNEYGIDFITAVPELFDLLATYSGRLAELPRFDIFASGGSHLSPELYRRVKEAFGVELLHGYGLTECAPVSRNIRGSSRPGSSGPVGNGIEWRISQPDEHGVGELEFRCDHMATGYFRRPVETEAAFRDGWFRSGDLASIDEGHLYFSRELKRTCKVNGTMVDIPEIEQALIRHAGVERATVALENGRLTATVGAAGLKPDRESIKSVRDHIKGVMADYKIPTIVIE